MTLNRIYIGAEHFTIDTEHQWLNVSDKDGAIVTFTGKVRRSEKQETESLLIEYYAKMVVSTLEDIIEQARARWKINRVSVIHRVGHIKANEEIVFVGVSSAHRIDAFSAAEFIMDFLKIRAPFWKKEKNAEGVHWIDAKSSDQDFAERW